MFTKEEMTTEKYDVWLAGLVEEDEALKVALSQWKLRKSDEAAPAKIERLEARIKANAESIAWLEKTYGSGSSSKRGRGKKADDVVEVEVPEVDAA